MSTPLAVGPKPTAAPARMSRAAWQLKLLPVMIGMLGVVTAAFLVFSLIQTDRVREQISAGPTLDLTRDLAALDCASPSATLPQQQACVRWKVLAELEAHTIASRYHQANAALVVRAWIKYLGFLTGMIFGIVGAVFMLGRLTEASSHLAAEGSLGKLSLETVSPGLVLALLGTILMVTTVLINPPTGVTDAPVYLDGSGASSDSAAPR